MGEKYCILYDHCFCCNKPIFENENYVTIAVFAFKEIEQGRKMEIPIGSYKHFHLECFREIAGDKFVQ